MARRNCKNNTVRERKKKFSLHLKVGDILLDNLCVTDAHSVPLTIHKALCFRNGETKSGKKVVCSDLPSQNWWGGTQNQTVDYYGRWLSGSDISLFSINGR